MTSERRKYTEEFKREAVRLMESTGKPIAELARDLGINDNNLYRWRNVYGNMPQANTLAGKKAMSIVSRSQP